MFSSKKSLKILPILLLALSGCSEVGTDATYSNKEREDLYKHGSVASDKGGIDLFGNNDNTKNLESNGLGVNAFLWRAALDTLSFMPIASADPFGGLIITDWYTAPDTPGERTKLNVYIRDRDLRADGVKVTVFRQTKQTSTAKGKPAQTDWVDAAVAPSTATALENAILTKARQIRMAQKQFQ